MPWIILRSVLIVKFAIDISKKDPEGRNVIVLCLLHSSFDVLKVIDQLLSPEYNMGDIILKQEYDFNPSINMALSLSAFA